MTVLWGEVEVPELTYVGYEFRAPQDPDKPPGLTHHPTGLRLVSTPTLEETRGGQLDFLLFGKLDFLLFGKKEEAWVARVSISTGRAVLFREVHSYSDLSRSAFNALPTEEKSAKKHAYLKANGYRIECFGVVPEGDSPPARWSVERRDALVMMVLYFMELEVAPISPLPSTQTLRVPGIPDDLQGTFRNPIWERQA